MVVWPQVYWHSLDMKSMERESGAHRGLIAETEAWIGDSGCGPNLGNK